MRSSVMPSRNHGHRDDHGSEHQRSLMLRSCRHAKVAFTSQQRICCLVYMQGFVTINVLRNLVGPPCTTSNRCTRAMVCSSSRPAGGTQE
jgi:hypothetical protein